jgi:hypothetical protein
MSMNLRRGFNCFFIVLTIVWSAYCLVGYPMLEQNEAYRQYYKDQKTCSNGVDYVHPNDIGDCLKRAEQNWRTVDSRWSFKNFWLSTWKLLLLAVVVLPLLLYGLCRGAAGVTVWVWRGFRTQH